LRQSIQQIEGLDGCATAGDLCGGRVELFSLSRYALAGFIVVQIGHFTSVGKVPPVGPQSGDS